MKKALILVHRYTGIVISLLMAAWCLSGIVMMYVGFPALEERERVAGLPELDLAGCCATEQALAGIGDVTIDAFAVEMLAGRPVLKVADQYGTVVADLLDGEILSGVTELQAQQVVEGYLARRGMEGSPVLLDTLETDQWTVTGAYDAYRPMHRFAAGDAAETYLYVAASNGEVVLDTTARERFWNWFGAVTHWLYPTILRQHAAAWAQVVIWTSLIGAFLTVTGLWLGILQIRAGRSGRFSPYRGWNWWHHVSGLVFGILLLAWVLSGFASMSPWGWLDGTGSGEERANLRSLEFTSRDALDAVQRLAASGAAGNAVRVASAPLAGRLYLAVQRTDGTVERLEAGSLLPEPLREEELAQLAGRIRPDVPVIDAQLLATADEYYYDDHDGARSYPVYRVVLDDAERTRYYLDPVTGALLQKTDRDGRWYRWLFEAFHRWDFSAGLRQRPLWDLVVLPLMLGVTALSLTGVYLGWRRVKPKRRAVQLRATPHPAVPPPSRAPHG